MSGRGFAFGYMCLLSTPLQNKLHAGTPDPTNGVYYAYQKPLLLAMTECIQRGDAVDLDVFHTQKATRGDNNDEDSVMESQGEVNRDRGG